jgi:nucleotide-binding universal stress UspA family protein
MSIEKPMQIGAAIEDFQRSRRRALMDDLFARLTGRSNDLLVYEEVRLKLRAQVQVERGLQDIPIDAIVGSVGRYTDFTRNFLPRYERSKERWTRVMGVATQLSGFPPIEVYQIGGWYFVSDGNHRISVAREMKATHIQAYVTEIETRVPIDARTSPDQLIIMSEYADFLEQTGFDRLYPAVRLETTVPGQYRLLLEQVQAQQTLLTERSGRSTSMEDAVRAWYGNVYHPVIEVIRERGMLRDFPNRTETDLFVWLSEHRAALAEDLGWEVKHAAAAEDFITQRSAQPERVAARISERLLDAIRPDAFEAGPPLGTWRLQRESDHTNPHLFSDILVPVNGGEPGWLALAQAIGIARREGGSRLLGLYVVNNENERPGETARAVQAEFEARCRDAGIDGRLTIGVGGAAHLICDRARWTDLVVVKLTYPPGTQMIERFRSGFRALVQRCSQPLLAIVGSPTPLHHALLAYNSSPKAQEALYMAAYLAHQWAMQVTVLTVKESGSSAIADGDAARNYLEAHGIEATYLIEEGPTAERILAAASTSDCDLIIMGGYGRAPAVEIAVGSTVDDVFRNSYLPVLVCR